MVPGSYSLWTFILPGSCNLGKFINTSVGVADTSTLFSRNFIGIGHEPRYFELDIFAYIANLV
jgi:hypothetical protein